MAYLGKKEHQDRKDFQDLEEALGNLEPLEYPDFLVLKVIEEHKV
jgi:hypothetical protein